MRQPRLNRLGLSRRPEHSPDRYVSFAMNVALEYRVQARLARTLAAMEADAEAAEALEQLARSCDNLADDIEKRASSINKP